MVIGFFENRGKRKRVKMRLKKMGFILLMFSWVFLNSGCSYMVKNGQHKIYLKPQYGIDKFVVVQGYNIHYVEAGEGPPILLIPGAFSTYRHWNRVIPLLSKHYRLLCIDYLGVGDSDKPRSGFKYTIEEQTDLIANMMEKLQIPKVHIVGVSYGGAIALNIAARYPEKVDKIVSIEGNGINGNKHQKNSYGPMEDFLKFPVVGEIPIGIIRSGLADKFIVKSVMGKAWKDLNELEKKEMTEIVSQNNKTASRISWYHISRTLKTSKDFTEEAKTVTIPILYLYGENSDYHDMAKGNADFLKIHLPHVEVVSFEDGIHDLQLQKPEEVSNLILEFLAKNKTTQQSEITKSKIPMSQ
jgi:pimeloyl-ACP methyl ester carboxylesterase